jgi:hypothetical protein
MFGGRASGSIYYQARPSLRDWLLAWRDGDRKKGRPLHFVLDPPELLNPASLPCPSYRSRWCAKTSRTFTWASIHPRVGCVWRLHWSSPMTLFSNNHVKLISGAPPRCGGKGRQESAIGKFLKESCSTKERTDPVLENFITKGKRGPKPPSR